MVSALTLAELAYGIPLAPDPLEATRRAQVYARVKTWVTPVPFDLAAADKYGELVGLVRATGRSPRLRRLDLMIAATAAALGVPLFTSDRTAFAGLDSMVNIIYVAGEVQITVQGIRVQIEQPGSRLREVDGHLVLPSGPPLGVDDLRELRLGNQR